MAITSQPTVATGDTIEAAYSNTNRDNVSVLDVRTGGDPGAANKLLLSSSPLAAAWVNTISGTLITSLSIPSTAYVNGSVGTAALGTNSVTTAKIGAVQVVLGHMAADSVAEANIVNGNVTEAKIAPGAVTATKIGNLAVTINAMAVNSVAEANIINGNVTAVKLASDAVTTGKILDANVTAAKLASGAAVSNIGYTPTKIASGTYTGTGATTARQITTGFVTKLAFAYANNGSGVDTLFVFVTTSVGMQMSTGPLVQGSSAVHLHASDGFVVSDGTSNGNVTGLTYTWIAFG